MESEDFVDILVLKDLNRTLFTESSEGSILLVNNGQKVAMEKL